MLGCKFDKCIIHILIVAHLHTVIFLLKEMQMMTAFMTVSDVKLLFSVNRTIHFYYKDPSLFVFDHDYYTIIRTYH